MKERRYDQSKKTKRTDAILAWVMRISLGMMLLSWIVAYYPPYERIWYDKTEPVTWQLCEKTKAEYENSELAWIDYSVSRFSGYPTEGMKTEDIKNYEHFYQKKDEPICLEVDASKLTPTGVYAKVYDFSPRYSGSSPSKYHPVRSGTVTTSYSSPPDITTRAGAFLNRCRAIYAQYYILAFEERDRVLVLLNDTVVDIPKKGKVMLPYAAVSGLMLDLEGPEISELVMKHNLKYDDDYMYFLDASTYWFEFGLDKNDFDGVRGCILAILLATGGGGLFLSFAYLMIASSKSIDNKE